MPAFFQTVPGSVIAPGISETINTDEEKRIAALPYALHYFEPERMADIATVTSYRDRMTPGWPITKTGTGGTYDATETSFNNQPSVTLTTCRFDYRAKTVPIAGGFAAIVVAELASDTTSNLFGILDRAGSLRASYRYSSTNDAYIFCDNFTDDSANANNNVVANATLNSPLVHFFSYDPETDTSLISINGGSKQSKVHSAHAAPTYDEYSRFVIGGSTANWQGKMARAIIFNNPMQTDALEAIVDAEIAALLAKYGIS